MVLNSREQCTDAIVNIFVPSRVALTLVHLLLTLQTSVNLFQSSCYFVFRGSALISCLNCTCNFSLSLVRQTSLCLIPDSIAGLTRRWIPNNDLKSQARRNNRIRSPSPPFFIHQETALPCPLAVIKHTNKNWRKACIDL